MNREYEFTVFNSLGDIECSGTGYNYNEVLREGQHYLYQYKEDDKGARLEVYQVDRTLLRCDV